MGNPGKYPGFLVVVVVFLQHPTGNAWWETPELFSGQQTTWEGV